MTRYDEIKRAAFRSCALELKATLVTATRDGDPVDAALFNAAIETFEGYAEGDDAPDDGRNLKLLADCNGVPCGICKGDGRSLFANSVWRCTACDGSGKAAR